MAVWQFQFIDEMSSAERISAHIRAMSADQWAVHAWTTAAIDVIYPFAYAFFFIGVAIRYFVHFGVRLAIHALQASQTLFITLLGQALRMPHNPRSISPLERPA